MTNSDQFLVIEKAYDKFLLENKYICKAKIFWDNEHNNLIANGKEAFHK